MFAPNVLSTYNVIEAATKLGVRKIIIASSITAYGGFLSEGQRALRPALPVPRSPETESHRAAPRLNAWMGRRPRVDHEIGQAALDHVDDSGDRIPGNGVEERIGPAEVVSGRYDVIHCKERVAGVRRLALENVEPGSGDPFFPKRGDQRLLVDDRSAGDIDEVSGRLHQSETSPNSANAASPC